MLPRIGTLIFSAFIALSAIGAPAPLDQLLEPIRKKSKLPAIAAAVVRNGEVVAAGAVGVRKANSTNAVTLDDKFHIGSITKPMTATVAAMLVEEGRLSWTTTVREAFPDWKTSIHPDYAEVTLQQLLSHRAGLPGDLLKHGTVWRKVWNRNSQPPTDQRVALARELLAESPAQPPGTKYVYANAGYTVAGLMVEQKERKPWEELITERLFRPLGMASAGFGMPATPPRGVDQPWGHVIRAGQVFPIAPGPNADNPAAIGPGGTVHCSVLDLAKFANLHLQGARGRAKLLKTETFERLHTSIEGQAYGLGWATGTRGWAKGRVLNHTGSNTMNMAVVWIAPEIDFAIVIVSNLGGEEAGKACDDAASALIKHFLK